MKYPNEGAFVMAALQGLCTHSAAKGHYDVTDLAKRAVAIGRAAAKAHAEALDAEDKDAGHTDEHED